MSGQQSDHQVMACLDALQRNVRDALADKKVAEVAAAAGLHPDDVAGVATGAILADVYILARLEATLGVPLWPRIAAPTGEG